MKKLKIKLLTAITILLLVIFENSYSQNTVPNGSGGGLVGIGTIAPVSVLHLDGNPYTTGNVFQSDCTCRSNNKLANASWRGPNGEAL